jgi:hypothetical protein
VCGVGRVIRPGRERIEEHDVDVDARAAGCPAAAAIRS